MPLMKAMRPISNEGTCEKIKDCVSSGKKRAQERPLHQDGTLSIRVGARSSKTGAKTTAETVRRGGMVIGTQSSFGWIHAYLADLVSWSDAFTGCVQAIRPFESSSRERSPRFHESGNGQGC